ncbi:MAG TPA: YicC family protein [Candidatus Enterenecus stercoripullorum]|nr:YicC family protein [Candidatus Enterenecus stercoripullorum]
MVKSMTGYGRGEQTREQTTITVELRSVNNRYLDCTVKMPRTYIFAEDAIKERVQSRVARGKVDVFISVVQTGGEAFSVTVNEELAKAYMEALRQLYELEGGQRVRMDYFSTDLARFPDVLTVEKQPEDQDALKALLMEVLDTALDDFDAMRCREGGRMAQDILSRADAIEKLTGQIEERSPQTVADYRARLESKMREVLQNTQVDEGRLLTEAAIFADKVAVDEETVRLRSHLAQLRELLAQGGAVGRKLDFLIQEFNREANTIGSKCNDIENTRHVVDLKAEIEKIREQVQNLE